MITADTIISINDIKIFEKPEDSEHAFKMLRELCDEGSHQAYTSVWVAFLDRKTQNIRKLQNTLTGTNVFFHKLTNE